MTMFQFALVCEAPADIDVVSKLADREVTRHVAWLLDTIELVRVWRGARRDESFILWKNLDAESAAAGAPRTLGLFDGEPGLAYAAATRKALVLFQSLPQVPDGVVLSADMDSSPERRQGMAQARDKYVWPWGEATILATPDREKEAWELAGFVAADDTESNLIASQRRLLGFDPCIEAHRLRHTRGEDRDPKVVLNKLCQGSHERRRACAETDLTVLRQRGGGSGLAAFLEEVETRLAPVFKK
jgi:hypothetical protein